MVVGGATAGRVDRALVRLVHQGLEWRDLMLQAREDGIAQLARQAGVCGSHFTRVLRLGFLAPDIIEAIVLGRQPVGLTATKLKRTVDMPVCWAEQRRLLGFPDSAEQG